MVELASAFVVVVIDVIKVVLVVTTVVVEATGVVEAIEEVVRGGVHDTGARQIPPWLLELASGTLPNRFAISAKTLLVVADVLAVGWSGHQ